MTTIFFPFIRILIGLLFVVSGAEKLIWPYQNFQYVLEGYQLLTPDIEKFVAIVFPWIELVVGLFMVLGVWLNITLRAVLGMFALFILIISQALLRKLPIDECGCFGQLITLKPHQTLIMDSVFLLLTSLALANIKKVEAFSLDRYFKS